MFDAVKETDWLFLFASDLLQVYSYIQFIFIHCYVIRMQVPVWQYISVMLRLGVSLIWQPGRNNPV